MTDAAMDIWLDSAQYDGETLATLREKLMQDFNLSASQAAVLINGNSHRIKRSCTVEEAEKLVRQFAPWGIDLRVEVIPPGDVGPLNTCAPSKKETGQISTRSTLSLAPHGEKIPNLSRDKTTPNVVTDHLHLLAE